MSSNRTKRPDGYRAVLVAAAVLAASWAMASAAADSPDYPADRAQLLEDLGNQHPAVREALADGTVTADEVRVGVALAVACMEAAGIMVDEASFTEGGHITLQYRGGSTVDASHRADQVQARCFESHAEPLAEAYGAERMPTLRELDLYHNAVVSCLNTRGLDVDSIEAVDAVSDRAAVRDCSGEAEASVFGR